MSLTLFTLLFIFTATTTRTTTASPENLIAALKSKNITSVHLPSPSPETISQFSNSLIPSISSNNCSATSAWLSSHVTPFLPHVGISAISLGYNVTGANLLKLLLPAIDNVNEKVKELGVKFSTTVSLAFFNGRESVAKEVLDNVSEKNGSLFVSVDNRYLPLGLFSIKVDTGFVLIQYDSSSIDLMRYEISLDNNGEVQMDYGVIEARVSKVEETEKVKKDNDDDVLFLLMMCIWLLICINVFSQLTGYRLR